MEEVKRGRAKRKLLRVTFPNGKVVCYKSTTDTMIATMQELGDDVISNIKLEDIILNAIGDKCKFPIIKSNNFGHIDKKTIIPIGVKAKIDTKENTKIKTMEEFVY